MKKGRVAFQREIYRTHRGRRELKYRIDWDCMGERVCVSNDDDVLIECQAPFVRRLARALLDALKVRKSQR